MTSALSREGNFSSSLKCNRDGRAPRSPLLVQLAYPYARVRQQRLGTMTGVDLWQPQDSTHAAPTRTTKSSVRNVLDHPSLYTRYSKGSSLSSHRTPTLGNHVRAEHKATPFQIILDWPRMKIDKAFRIKLYVIGFE